MKTNILPTQAPAAVPAGAYQEMLSELGRFYSLEKPETDGQIKERLDAFFQYCMRSGLRPGIEGLALVLGVSRETIWRWSRGEGCSRQRQELIQQAKRFVFAVLEQAHLSGRLNPASAIFLSKNWLGYRDNLTIEPATAVSHSLEAELSPEQIQQQLEQDIPID